MGNSVFATSVIMIALQNHQIQTLFNQTQFININLGRKYLKTRYLLDTNKLRQNILIALCLLSNCSVIIPVFLNCLWQNNLFWYYRYLLIVFPFFQSPLLWSFFTLCEIWYNFGGILSTWFIFFAPQTYFISIKFWLKLIS